MDQIFGLNMPKSGLVETMRNLISETSMASFSAISGFLWPKGQSAKLSGMIEEFTHKNRSLFNRLDIWSKIGKSA